MSRGRFKIPFHKTKYTGQVNKIINTTIFIIQYNPQTDVNIGTQLDCATLKSWSVIKKLEDGVGQTRSWNNTYYFSESFMLQCCSKTKVRRDLLAQTEQKISDKKKRK